MKRFKNILVIVGDDGNPKTNPALARGLELAKNNHAQLTLMDVVGQPTSVISEYNGIFKTEELISMLVAKREKVLNSISEKYGTEIKTKVVVGRDFIEIVRQIILDEHDLLIKVANEHPESFDSSDFHLMRKCPKPVWLLKSSVKDKPQKVLAAIDLSLENEDEGKTLNTMIMDLATSLAAWEKTELDVLSCWSLYGESSLSESGFLKVSEERLNKFLKDEENANSQLMSQLISRYSAYKVHSHLIKGHPVDLIPAFTHENNIDVVVMGTVARSGIPGLLIGNTAETILHLIDASVITLKPTHFESPITLAKA